MSAKPEEHREDHARTRASDFERRLATYGRIGIPIATVLAAAAFGWLRGPGPAILVLAAGALVAAIAVFWASIRTLLGETPLSGADAYAIGSPRAEEEQKRAVLRALKDLELERSVGKISEEDHRALVAKYRAEAKRLLRVIDESARPGRARALGLVERRLRKEGLLDGGEEARGADEGEPQREDDALAATPASSVEAVAAEIERGRSSGEHEPAAAPGKPLRKRKGRRKPAQGAAGSASGTRARTCKACDTTNDEDAVFCKKCGARHAPSSAPPRDAEAAEAADGASEGGAGSA